jgi:hypothetical protein
MGAPLHCRLEATGRATAAVVRSLAAMSDDFWWLQQETRGQCFPPAVAATVGTVTIAASGRFRKPHLKGSHCGRTAWGPHMAATALVTRLKTYNVN